MQIRRPYRQIYFQNSDFTFVDKLQRIIKGDKLLKTYYDLGKVPSHLKTRNQLLDLGLVPTDRSEIAGELTVYIDDYYKGDFPCITYNLYNINQTVQLDSDDNALTARKICEALYILNTSDNKNIKNKGGKVKEKWEKFYSIKREVLSLMHSEGRVQLVGYQDSFKYIKTFNAYYIYHDGNTKYGFHILITKDLYSKIEEKLYYLGKSDDRQNEKILDNRKKNHKNLNDNELLEYFNFLYKFISNHNK